MERPAGRGIVRARRINASIECPGSRRQPRPRADRRGSCRPARVSRRRKGRNPLCGPRSACSAAGTAIRRYAGLRRRPPWFRRHAAAAHAGSLRLPGGRAPPDSIADAGTPIVEHGVDRRARTSGAGSGGPWPAAGRSGRRPQPAAQPQRIAVIALAIAVIEVMVAVIAARARPSHRRSGIEQPCAPPLRRRDDAVGIRAEGAVRLLDRVQILPACDDRAPHTAPAGRARCRRSGSRSTGTPWSTRRAARTAAATSRAIGAVSAEGLACSRS